ncbi:MAG: L-2-amino-thiazoline-4-carboxylic acid hydrolase [Treponema sp.]|nr:L-2-amino-thiazoline-4-carboxylic acid hydrolase [Treponema sp.]
MTIKNTPRKNGFFLKIVRKFFEHRALWLFFLYDEAQKNGIKPETFAPNAIRRCGIYHGMKALTGKDIAVHTPNIADSAEKTEGSSCRLLKKNLFTSTGKAVFEMKFLKLDDDSFDVDFHYCPLVTAWKKQGCSDEEIDKLCDWAMEGDRGIADVFGCKLELEKTIARGDGVCQIRFRRQ